MTLLLPAPLSVFRSARPRRTATRIRVARPSRRLGPTYTNPLYERDTPDPAVIRVGGWYYLTSTSGNARDAFPLRRSRNLVDWEDVGHLFPRGHRPKWAMKDFWAPEIHRMGRRFVVHFTARDRSGRLCLGVATAPRIEGPWTAQPEPLLCEEGMGLIDSHLFRDRDGQWYLYWKKDGNGCSPQQATPLLVQPLSADGLRLTGEAREVLTNDQEWEGFLVEGPWMVRRGRFYYLFYSGNAYWNEHYAVGVARSTSPMGPFRKATETVLRRDEHWMGPGHGCVIRTADRKDYFVYHAWQRGRVGGKNPRMLLMDQIHWEKGWPRIHDGSPSNEAQPAPAPLRTVGRRRSKELL